MTTPPVALVTGSGKRRVGWHIAEALAARGYTLAVHYHSSAAEAVLMSTGAFFAAGGAWVCAHTGVVPAPKANTKATRSAIRRVIAHLLWHVVCAD